MDKKKIALILIFLVLLEFRFIYIPLKKKVGSLDKLIIAKQKDRETLLKLCDEYKEKGYKNEPLKIVKKEFSLLSYTGAIIEKKGIERNITGLQPTRTDIKENLTVEGVRIGLKGLTLQQLYNFLYEIEQSKEGIYISDFRMQKEKDTPHLLDVDMELLIVKQID